MDDINGQPQIFYFYHGDVYYPNCMQISSFTIINNTENCYNDMPVLIHTNKTNITAFMTHSYILRRTSTVINCNAVDYTLYFESLRLSIKRYGNTVITTSYIPGEKELLKLNALASSIVNYNHNQMLIEQHDLLDSIIPMLSIPEKMGMFMVIPSTEDFKEDKVSIAEFLGINSLWQNFKKYIIITEYVIAAILILLI